MTQSKGLNSNCSPLVTVAMPIYNAGKYLRPAVISIIQQTYQNWEMYIVDDGSTDNALSCISDIKDSRIKVIKDGLNKGLAARLNEVIRLANGYYFARMDQDDISYPDRFAKQIESFKNDPDLDLLATRAIKITMESKPVGYLPSALTHEKIVSAPWRGFYMPHPSWMGKLKWFKKHFYAEPGPYLCEDQELLLRTFAFSKFSSLQDVCLAYRVRDKANLGKLFKIRYQLICLQLNYAFQEKSFNFIVLSILFFAFKLSKDVYAAMLRLKYTPYFRGEVCNKERVKFTHILNSL